MKKLLLAVAVSGLAACTPVGPNFKSPEMVVAQRFAQTGSVQLRSTIDPAWWRQLKDPLLNDMMDRGLSQNLTLQLMQERIAEAQLLLQATGPGSQLSGDLTASASARRIDGVRSDTKSAGLGFGFVIDLFGERRRRQEEAEAQVMEAVFLAAESRLDYQRAVMNAYVSARYFRTAFRLRQNSIANRQRVLRTLRDRRDVGEETNLGVRRAEAELKTEQAALPELRAGLQTSAFALATLLSESGDKLLSELNATSATQPTPGRAVSAGVPADLLRNRPDIRAAEARYAAAVATAGVAEAQLYPSLRLGGLVSIGTTDTVSFGPSLSLPVFDQGTRRLQRDAAVSRMRQSELRWRGAVLSAVEDVQSELVRNRSWAQQVSALADVVNSYRVAARLSRESYELGAVTLPELLDAEDQLTQSVFRLALARRSYALSWAELNIVSGQGWDVIERGNESSEGF